MPLKSHHKGSFLLGSLALITGVMIITLGIYYLYKTNISIISQEHRLNNAKSAAYSGLEYSKKLLKNDPDWSDNNGVISTQTLETSPNKSFSATGVPIDINTIDLTVIGTYRTQQYTLTQRVTKSGSTTSTDHRIAAGYQGSMFIKDNILYAVGKNAYGQFGNGNTSTLTTITQILTNVKHVSLGALNSSIIKTDNTLWVSGLYFTNTYTNLTNGTDFSKTTHGFAHLLAINNSNELWGMGSNYTGQLGDGSFNFHSNLILITSNVKEVAAGWNHSLIIKTDNTLWTTGENTHGQLGIGDTTARNQFTFVTSNVKLIAAGYNFSLFIKTDNTLWGMGQSANGNMGLATNDSYLTPISIPITGTPKSLHITNDSPFLIKDDNSIWVTGSNYYGQLGLGHTNLQSTFTQVTAPSNSIYSIAPGYYHTLLLLNDNTFWSTGMNYNYELGLGNTSNQSSFQLISFP